MLNGVIGKGVTQLNTDLNIPMVDTNPGYPVVVNVTITNTTTSSGTYTFSIMENTESSPSNEDNIYINSAIGPNETINLGNFILSPNEIISINSNVTGIAVRVTGVQQPS